jgi:hypothetical protein
MKQTPEECRSGTKDEDPILNKSGQNLRKRHETRHNPKLEHLHLSLPAKRKRRRKEKTQTNHHSLKRLGEQQLHSLNGWEKASLH